MFIIDIILVSLLIFVIWQIFKVLTVLTVQWCSDHLYIKACNFIIYHYLNLCARAQSGEVIALLDWQDKVTYSVALPSGTDGIKISYFNWQLQIYPIWLHEDGLVTHPHGGFSIPQYWLPLDLEKRTFMILQGARGFDI